MEKKSPKEKSQTVSIKFEEFIMKAFPHTKNTFIPTISTTIVSNLRTCCKSTEDGTFAYVRGGAMRTFSLSTYGIEKELTDKVRKTDFGTDKLTREVMEHAFGRGKDLDLFIRRGDVSNDQIVNNILVSLSRFKDGEYDFKVKTQAIGGKANPQTLFMINFYNKNKPSEPPVFMLNFTNFSSSINSSQKEIRAGADIDLLSLGDINLDTGGNLVLNYPSPELTDMRKRLIDYYFSPRVGPLSDSPSFLHDMIAGFREINSRALYLPALLDPQNNFMTTDILISHRNYNKFTFPTRDKIKQIIQANRTEIEDNLLPLLSDIMFSFIANPIIALPFTYLNKSLIMTPLGQMIDSPEKMREVMRCMSERMGMKETDLFVMLSLKYTIYNSNTLLLIDALKDAKIIPEDWPHSYKGLLKLLNPLELL